MQRTCDYSGFSMVCLKPLYGPSMLPSFPAKSVISAMIQALAAGTDAEVISTLVGVSHLCDGPSPHVQAVVDANVCEALTVLCPTGPGAHVKPH